MDMDEKTQVEIVKEITALLEAKYVFPDVGKRLAVHLRSRLAADTPFLTFSSAQFATTLTDELFEIARDTHLRLDYDPARAAGGEDTAELMKTHFKRTRRNNFGFIKVERLSGNIGYLNICELPPPQVAGEIAAGAMAFVANTGALIFDIRGNEGGTPEMEQMLVSYLVDADPQPLSGIYSRDAGEKKDFHTLPEVPGQRMPNIPIYILVDRETHSAAEAFAYDLQALQRATIVGEPTRGGAHLVDFFPLRAQYVLMMPVARAINPITGGNWQGTGVIPNIRTSSEQALRTAHLAALEALLASAPDADEKAFLQAEMETFRAE